MVELHPEQALASADGPRDLKEAGSIPWSWQTVSALQHMWQSLHLNYEHYMNILDEAQEHRIWDKIPPDKPYGSESKMLREVEVGNAKDAHKRMKIQTLAATARRVMKHRGNRDGNQADKHQLEKAKRGDSSEYIMGLIKRENPEFAAKIAAGDEVFASMRAAAKAAGVELKPLTPTLRLSDNIERVATRIKERYSPEQLQDLLDSLQSAKSVPLPDLPVPGQTGES